MFTPLLTLLILFGPVAHAEGYIGITQVSEYTPREIELPSVDKRPARIGSSIKFDTPAPASPPPGKEAPDTRDHAYRGKVEKIDNWTKTAYGLLNDGSQEKWTEGLEQVYKEQIEEIRAGGLGYRPEYKKFIEKVMPKVEND